MATGLHAWQQVAEGCRGVSSRQERGTGTYVGHFLVTISHMGQQEFAILGGVSGFLVATTTHGSYQTSLLLDDSLRQEAQTCNASHKKERNQSGTHAPPLCLCLALGPRYISAVLLKRRLL